uniref:NADH dehydrogenase subunit 4L n=1 Tax=Pseudodiaptomus hessei TaxID=2919416 RepID=UPI002A81EF76|nr:NADH dehydrogenase subunit 4L [Pseudodiaptomus hessei]WOH21594.1 NADH dehydrogenase subunit 4L [Pseudodiaptomus hessei]
MFLVLSLFIVLMMLDFFNLSSIILIILFVEILFLMFSFLKNWFHLMILLIIMEMFMLKILLSMVMFSHSLIFVTMILSFITIMVIEASMGVSVLSLLVRFRGNDFIIN